MRCDVRSSRLHLWSIISVVANQGMFACAWSSWRVQVLIPRGLRVTITLQLSLQSKLFLFLISDVGSIGDLPNEFLNLGHLLLFARPG